MSGTRAKATPLLAALQLALAGALWAQSAAVDALVPAQPDGYVTDRAGVIDPAARDRMTSLIERLRATTGAEIAVVTLPDIGEQVVIILNSTRKSNEAVGNPKLVTTFDRYRAMRHRDRMTDKRFHTSE